jgi:uncharacterized membrane protein YczE
MMNNNRKYSEEELYRMAERRVHLRRDFLTHFVVYIAVNIFLAFINLFTSAGYLWFLWVTFGWGIGIVSHGVDTYVKLNMDRGAVEKEVERLRSKGL